ncbi:MAG: 1,4-alpha-glucan-branching enzyme [Lentisphaerae bacterium]|jgi:1,4-alpha-glucan branching enzyme|nr:1,4-alpha-glucan-branching enzyme [Lentisphaerota bacterium]
MIVHKRVRKLSEDPYLARFMPAIDERALRTESLYKRLCGKKKNLDEFASAHEFYGLHRTGKGWTFREHAPNAVSIWLVGDFSNWLRKPEYRLERISDDGDWEVLMPATAIEHGQHYHLEMEWHGGGGTRIPSYVRRVVQDSGTKLFSAQVWNPPVPYKWKSDFVVPDRDPIIYECHIGMAQEEPKVGTYVEFKNKILPRIAKAGYNTIQLMAIMEHPYYGSFGYQVSNFFAASSRFGTPEELKELIDAAHGLGMAVIMDLIHSHAVLNENEGIARFDGTNYLYFHDGPRGHHPVWNSSCFDYGRFSTLHFLLSNCRYWLDEFRFDGFRFDGITSMLYSHHGLGVDFTDYEQYFDYTVDEDAYTYLALANKLIHSIRPDAITIAEDVSGMPGLAAPVEDGGAGFDMRMAMGITEMWGKLAGKVPDQDWYIPWIWNELTSKRKDELTTCYVESHDQSLVGGKTFFFEMAGPAIYTDMRKEDENFAVERAVALHKIARLATLGTAGGGYLNFMGNEFGHPEWVDFPREGNDYTFLYARRQWSLRDNEMLKYSWLADFDEALIKLLSKQQDFLRLPVRYMNIDNGAKVIVFSRGACIFAINLHWTQSYSEWEIKVPPGSYELRLNTDSPKYGGQGRIADNQTFHALTEIAEKEMINKILVYLPARTAVILKRKRQVHS